VEAAVEVAARTAFLAPFLPALLQAGEKVVGRAADAVADEAFSYAKALWDRLRPKVGEKPDAQEAAEKVAARPDNEDALAALQAQLSKLLEEDEQLAADVAGIWKQAEAAHVVQVTASGERSVAIGGDVQNSTIVTGDQTAPQD
jgi:aldehyde:ferredoxin oxidoreductase